MGDAGILFLILFAITLFGTYIAVRRAWGQTLYIGSIGAILSMVFVILYALTYEKTSTAQAIFAGIVVGLGFAGATVVIANFFRANQPSAEIKFVSQASQEETTSGPNRNRPETSE